MLRRLGTFSTRMPFCNNRVGVLRHPSGRRSVYGVTYSSQGKSAVFLVDPLTGECARHHLPNGEKGAYADEAGPDGRLYLGTFSGRLYAFDPEAGEFELLCDIFPDQSAWGGAVSRHGLMFFGVTPSGSFGVWNIAEKRLVHTEIPRLPAGAWYAREFVDLPNGKILVCLTGPEVRLGIFDPKTFALEWHIPESLAGSSTALHLHMCGDALVMRIFPRDEIVFLDWRNFSLLRRTATPGWNHKVFFGSRVFTGDALTGDLLELDGEKWETVGTPVPHDTGDFAQLDDKTIVGITVDGTFFRFDLNTRESFTCVLPSEEFSGMYATALNSDGRENLYIGAYINQHLIRMNMDSGESVDMGRASAHVGQLLSTRFLDGRLFAAFYTDAGVVAYDPARSYELTKNPALLGLAGEDQNRPVGRMEYDGRYLYFATVAKYGLLGGAIVRIDPADGSIRTFRNIIPDQNLTGVIFDPATGLLFVAGATEGDQGTAVARSPEAHWAAWDPRTLRRVGGGALAAGSKYTTMLESTNTGLILGQHERGFFAIDALQLTLADAPIPAGWAHPTSVMLRASDGNLYGLGPRNLYRFDPHTGETTALADAFGRCLIEHSPGRLVFNKLAELFEYRF